ncbi:MAG TPA: carbon-nitrogen hydrolase family protein [Dehalococcoidia bacterium]|nr:carbon-nitrogen hydrolase family protein [Dehalococcoidia bacterium]
MKEVVKVSLVQFTAQWLDRETNAERMRQFAEEEAKRGAELIVFPETCNIGHCAPICPGDPMEFPGITSPSEFAIKYIKASEPVPGPTTDTLAAVARKHGVCIVVGLSELHPVVPYTAWNSAALIGPSGVLGLHRKWHLGQNEKMFWYAGNRADVYRTQLGNIGIMICYDAWFPELSRILTLKGAEILIAVFQGPNIPVIMDYERARNFAYVRAKENSVYFLACNRSGKEGKYTMVGHSAVVSPTGRVIAYSDTDQEMVLRAELSEDELVRARTTLTVFRDRRPEMYPLVAELPDGGMPAPPVPAPAKIGTGEMASPSERPMEVPAYPL